MDPENQAQILLTTHTNAAKEADMLATPIPAQAGDTVASGVTASVLNGKAKTGFNKLQKRLRRHVGQAIEEFNLIEDGDRPLAFCAERDIERYAQLRDFPIIPCNLCGSQEHLQRKLIKQMLLDWERDYPGRTGSIARALKNVAPSHLADKRIYPFVGL